MKCLVLQNVCQSKVQTIRSDNGTELKNHIFELFCLEKRINHQFSAPHTPQKNKVAERKNETLNEAARKMLE